MTDRVNSFTVVLREDIRDDDAAPIMAAILQLRGVISVEAHVTDPRDHVAQVRVRRELQSKLFEALK